MTRKKKGKKAKPIRKKASRTKARPGEERPEVGPRMDSLERLRIFAEGILGVDKERLKRP